MSASEKLTLSFEEQKLVLEEKKLEIEVEKLKVERLKGWTTGGSIVISLLIAAATVSFGVWSQHKQVMTQLDLQEKNARSQFEIKAAEIVMTTDTPTVTHNKARALLALFPDRLPNNFARSFEAHYYAAPKPTDSGIHYAPPNPRIPQVELLEPSPSP